MTDDTSTTTSIPGGDPFAGLDNDACAIDNAAPDSNGQTAAPRIDTAEVLEQVIAPACAICAPAWAIQADEVKQLASSYAGLIDKYFPGGVGEIGPELGAALVTLAVFGPRWSLPRKAEPRRDPSAPADQPAAAIPDGVPNVGMA